MQLQRLVRVRIRIRIRARIRARIRVRVRVRVGIRVRVRGRVRVRVRVTRSSTLSAGSACEASFSMSCRIELGRLSTPKPKWRESTSLHRCWVRVSTRVRVRVRRVRVRVRTSFESSTVKSEGISASRPSGSPG